ncbi:hypothetical protein CRM22_003796 [Opisthorchis felineus]|uniref:C2H2-type domain-containing protein n=1 Tax=Opisthorchis felineus TaxID=147828 RepID=A0A4S2M018_OPIFE|nr:hypothetical protein CRM22_003796 [Opisthorchis felineus]TGZ69307.1 hypothetical protein CRM22_003796 [Opisthorchis felineus]TGZ69308.1 hypothetical protein CRM22_003796 [Opisthorchis felineus]TGZ69309.1 hypothetical protein CRM22_003796 [Opisthorchis felineus]
MTSSQLPQSVDSSMDFDDKHSIDLSARIAQPTLVPGSQAFPAPFFAEQANQAGPHSENNRAMTVERSSSNHRLDVIEVDGKGCYFCKICKRQLNSLISLRQHESGKRHQNALATSAAMSPASSFGEDSVSSSHHQHSPTRHPLKDRSNLLDILGLEPSFFAERSMTKNLLPHSRQNPNVSDQITPLGSTVMDCLEKKLENDIPPRIEPEPITISSRSSICGLKVRDVLKRVCLTQMISLLSDQAGSPLPVTNSLEDEQILLQTLTGLCNGTLSNRSSNNYFDETSVGSRVLSPNQLARDFLLLSWCQQLAMLDK